MSLLINLIRKFQVKYNCFIKTITTLHQIGDYRRRNVVVRRLDRIEIEKLKVVRWITRTQNYGGVLTKNNIYFSRKIIT